MILPSIHFAMPLQPLHHLETRSLIDYREPNRFHFQVAHNQGWLVLRACKRSRKFLLQKVEAGAIECSGTAVFSLFSVLLSSSCLLGIRVST